VAVCSVVLRLVRRDAARAVDEERAS